MDCLDKQLHSYIVKYTISFFHGIPSVYKYFDLPVSSDEPVSYFMLVKCAKSIPRTIWNQWKTETLYCLAIDNKRLQQIDLEISGRPFREKVVEMILDVLYNTILS